MLRIAMVFACLLVTPAMSALGQAAQNSPQDDRQTDGCFALLERIPETYRTPVREALGRAGGNADSLLAALGAMEDERIEGAAFLIANMPERDLLEVEAAFLIENINLAYDTWEDSPWHEGVTPQQFLQYILPFASLNERRDDWRADFYEQLREECWKFDNTLDATNWLNDHLNDHFEVYFHATRRPKPDQSPYESIEAGYASCTGLSILMTDCCRAVGIPARIVGVPQWTEIQGNHNWVEVFHDRWYNVGGTDSDARDDDWVNGRCRTMTDPDQWQHAVYAATFRKTDTHFPLVWDLDIDYVPALNVTRFYSEATEVELEIPAFAKGPEKAEVLVYWSGELVARQAVSPGALHATVQLAGGTTYRVVFIGPDGTEHETELSLE